MTPRELIPAMADAVALLDQACDRSAAYARRDGGSTARVDRLGATCEPIQPRAGFTLSAWVGGRLVERSCDDLTASAVARCARDLAARVRSLGAGATVRAPAPSEPTVRHFAHPQRSDARLVPAADKIAAARALRAGLDGAERLREAIAIVGDSHAEIVHVDREHRLSQELHRVRQILVGVFAEGTQQAQLHAGCERIGGWEHLGDARPWVDELRRDGPRLLGASRLPDPGEHDCVFDGHFAGMFAHEAFGHGTEQDLFLSERSQGAHWLGRAVASPLVTMADDPANGWAASYFFDDEGVLASPTVIVRDGVLVQGINDQASAFALRARGLDVAKTANGRREAYDHKPYARMSNTFFAAGVSSLDEMVAGIAHGYLLRHPSNGMEDPKGWGIQLEGAMAEEIRDGRLTGRIYAPVVVTGSVPKLLHSVSMVGSEVVEASLGMCGKGYKEWVKVTDGGPALKLRAVLA